jgi:O-antigen ligase
MSIRVTLLSLIVVGLVIYAWRDWFYALCGAILMMALVEHPDMPKNILGIQGFNPWNALMLSILMAWLVQRRGEGIVWDMPRYLSGMLLLYLLVIIVGWIRMMLDRSYLKYDTGELISEHLINTIKWVLPGLLLFDGARTRRRIVVAMVSILGVYLLLGAQVIRWMPVDSALSGDSLTARSHKIILNEIGYHAVNMSMMLSGASWAALATLPLVSSRRGKVLIVLVFLAIAYGQALTGGRMGYVTWGIVGLSLSLIRWRRYLLLVPLVPIILSIAVPGVMERMLQGFDQTNAAGEARVNAYEVTSGRNLIWPYVVDKIQERPTWGFGRQAMVRVGLVDFLWAHYRESFPHPHNAYLEMLLDNGIVGFFLVIPFYLVMLFLAVRLFLDRQSPLASAVGGMTLALVLALLVASMGSQTFYPREGAVGMWAAIGLMLRVSLERRRVWAETAELAYAQPAIAYGQMSGLGNGLRNTTAAETTIA